MVDLSTLIHAAWARSLSKFGQHEKASFRPVGDGRSSGKRVLQEIGQIASPDHPVVTTAGTVIVVSDPVLG